MPRPHSAQSYLSSVAGYSKPKPLRQILHHPNRRIKQLMPRAYTCRHSLRLGAQSGYQPLRRIAGSEPIAG